MYILIIKNEYQNNSQLQGVISTPEDEVVNGVDCIYGQITSANFATISSTLVSGTYSVSDGIILPEEARKKNQ